MNAVDIMWLLQWCELKVDVTLCMVHKMSYIKGCDVIHTVVQRSYLEGL